MKSNTDIFNKLPEDSLVRQQCIKKGTGHLFWKSQPQQGCSYIEHVLKAADAPPKKHLFSRQGGFWDVISSGKDTKDLEKSINKILPESSFTIKTQEYEKVVNTYKPPLTTKEIEEHIHKFQEERRIRNNR